MLTDCITSTSSFDPGPGLRIRRLRVRLLLGVFNIVLYQRVISQNAGSKTSTNELSGLHTEVVGL